MPKLRRSKVGSIIRWAIDKSACNTVIHNAEYCSFVVVQSWWNDAPIKENTLGHPKAALLVPRYAIFGCSVFVGGIVAGVEARAAAPIAIGAAAYDLYKWLAR